MLSHMHNQWPWFDLSSCRVQTPRISWCQETTVHQRSSWDRPPVETSCSISWTSWISNARTTDFQWTCGVQLLRSSSLQRIRFSSRTGHGPLITVFFIFFSPMAQYQSAAQGETNNQMLLEMMKVCGPFPHPGPGRDMKSLSGDGHEMFGQDLDTLAQNLRLKLALTGRFSLKHFGANGDFLNAKGRD